MSEILKKSDVTSINEGANSCFVEDDRSDVMESLNQIGENLSRVGLDVAVSADIVQEIAATAKKDVQHFSVFVEQISDLKHTTTEISDNISKAKSVTHDASQEINASQSTVVSTNEEISNLIEAVRESEARLVKLNEALESVGSITSVINGIAKQTNLLALNATIEAARAGEAGKGFSVVANEVKALASSTSEATMQIEETLGEIKTGFDLLNVTSENTSKTALKVQNCSSTFSDILSKVSEAMETIDLTTGVIDQQMTTVNSTCHDFSENSTEMALNMQNSSEKLNDVSQSMRHVADESDKLVLLSVMNGTNKDEAAIIHKATMAAERVAVLFEDAVSLNELTEEDLFDREHELVPNTDPQQFIAKFTDFSDQKISPLIEEIVSSDERIAWCAATDNTAYIATNIKKVSQPQGDDPVWNMANCRNHRYFRDLTGTRVAKNQEPLLLQTYQRDMGGGVFVPMKDISSPIFVNGRHWGGFRIGYTPD